MKQLFRILAQTLSLLAVVGGCRKTQTIEKQKDIEAFSALHHISEAPAPIANAAQSVVKIVFPLAQGTGSIVKIPGSPDSLLMTNSHVAGPQNCAATGCYVDLLTDFQKGSERGYYFIKIIPVAASPDVDVSFFRSNPTPPTRRLQCHQRLNSRSNRRAI